MPQDKPFDLDTSGGTFRVSCPDCPVATGQLITQDSTGHLAMGRDPNDLAQVIAVDGNRALRVDCMNCVTHSDFWGFAALLFFVITLAYAGLAGKK